MTSFKSKMINFLIRNNHLLRGKLKKEVFDFTTSIQGFRDRCEKGAARFGKTTEGISLTTQLIEGIKSEWHIPENTDADKIILYVHGGGYVSGSCSDHRGVVSKFAKATGYTTLIYEYRLAPEHPFPAALDDSLNIYQWLLESGYIAEKIIIAGESAGGGLCLAILLTLKERNVSAGFCNKWNI
jgi:acetyl esterase/lipase